MQIHTQLKPYLASLEQTITCCITLEPLTSATTLYPCMHKVSSFAAKTILAQPQVEKRVCPLCRVTITKDYPDLLYSRIAEQAIAFIAFSKKKEKKSPQEIYFFLQKNIFPLITHPYESSINPYELSINCSLQGLLHPLHGPLQRAFTCIPCMHRMHFPDLAAEKRNLKLSTLCTYGNAGYCLRVAEDIKPDHSMRGVAEEVLKIKTFLLAYNADLLTKFYRDPYYKFSLSGLRLYLTTEDVSRCQLVSTCWKKMWQDSAIEKQLLSVKRVQKRNASPIRGHCPWNTRNRCKFTPSKFPRVSRDGTYYGGTYYYENRMLDKQVPEYPFIHSQNIRMIMIRNLE